MSRWFDAQVQKEKNFQRRQKYEFEKHAVELRREIDEAKAAYREYPYERTKKYIDSRVQELEDMEDEVMDTASASATADELRHEIEILGRLEAKADTSE